MTTPTLDRITHVPVPDPVHTGGMVALVPAAEYAVKLAVAGGLPAGELHLTLCYLGDDVTTWPPEVVEAVRQAALEIADPAATENEPVPAGLVQGSLTLNVFAWSQFNPNGGPDGQEPCLVYQFSGDDDYVQVENLASLVQAEMRDAVGEAFFPEQHARFEPHITAGYGLPPTSLSYTGPVVFDRLRVALGDNVIDMPLGGDGSMAADGSLKASAAVMGAAEGRNSKSGSIYTCHPQNATNVDAHSNSTQLGPQISPQMQQNYAENTTSKRHEPELCPDIPAVSALQASLERPEGTQLTPSASSARSVKGASATGTIITNTRSKQANERSDGTKLTATTHGSAVNATPQIADADLEAGSPGKTWNTSFGSNRGNVQYVNSGLTQTTLTGKTVEPTLTTTMPLSVFASGSAHTATKGWDGSGMSQNTSEQQQIILNDIELPPIDWFRDPQLTEPTALTVDNDGRVTGHLALWHTPHIGFPGRSVTPPRSRSDYAYFHTGSRNVLDDTHTVTIATGHITLDTGHADIGDDYRSASAHYDDTGTLVADVCAGEDQHGIWISGALSPGIDDLKLHKFRACGLSGDWRRIGPGLELVAALSVPTPGFPIPRSRVASGEPFALVAAGAVLPPTLAPAVDYDALADAMVARMEHRQAVTAALTSRKTALLAELDDSPARMAALLAEFGDDDALVAVAGREVTPKDVESTRRLKEYWAHGEGAAKIQWGVDGDFDRCRLHLGKYVPPGHTLDGLCANLHKEAIGVWPGQEHGGRGHKKGKH